MSGSGSAKAKRTAARLAAVQALYQLELGGGAGPAGQVLYDLMHLRQDDLPAPLVEPDRDLLARIVGGEATRRGDIDDLLAAALADSRSLERSEAVLRAALRAGTFELLTDGDTAPGIIINDYVNVAHAFFGGAEPGKVNAVLNAVAQALGRVPPPGATADGTTA